jgi:hypothetical protein
MKLAITLFLSAAIATSTPKEDYMSFMSDFMKNTQLAFDFTITQNAGSKSHVSTGYYKRSDAYYMLKNENYLIFSTKEVTVSILESDKIILLEEPQPADNLFLINTEDMKEAITKVTEAGGGDIAVKEWHVVGKGWKGKAVIKANVEKRIPMQISMYSKEANPAKDKPLTSIKFNNVSKASIDKQVFSISSFVQKKGNQWVLTKKYSNYELINNLD